MYVTRKISDCRREPELLEIPPAGPFSGFLVIQDEEAEAKARCCFGLCKVTNIDELPIPQNKTITISYTTGGGEISNTSYDYVMLIPVPGKLLSANTYYAIRSKGKRQGEAHTCSTENDMTSCCFCTFIHDVKSKPLEPGNPLQEFELLKHPAACSTFDGFESKSVSPGAFPPDFLRRKGWSVDAKTPKDFTLGEALGIDAVLRNRPPLLEIPIGDKSSERIVVGKWYVPFMFVKESFTSLKEQMKKSMYYEMVLEQRWEKVFESENAGGKKTVKVDVTINTEAVLLGGAVAASNGDAADGFTWYRGNNSSDAGRGVGLSSGIVERVKWEQKRGGWDGSSGRVVVEEAIEDKGWSRFACYVLVESFVLKRMDGTLVISFDFYHTHQTKCKWE